MWWHSPVPCHVTPALRDVLEREGGELTTDATYVVAPAALKAANVCLGQCWHMCSSSSNNRHSSLEEDPDTHFVVLPNLQERRGYASRNPGKSLPLSLWQRITCALCWPRRPARVRTLQDKAVSFMARRDRLCCLRRFGRQESRPATLWGKSPFEVAESVIGRPKDNSSWTGSESECRGAVCDGVLRNSTFFP